MADARRRASRAVWVYGALAFAVGVAATAVVVMFLSRGAIRTRSADPLPKVVLVANPDDEVAAGWLTALVEAGTDVAAVDPANYEPGPHLLVLGSLRSVAPAIENEVRRRVRVGGGIMIVGTIPSELADLVEATTARRTGTEQSFQIAEQPSPVLARVRPGFGATLPPLPVVLEERPAMSVDARWESPPDAAVAHWTSGVARIVWYGAEISQQELKNIPMLAVMLRASVRWLAAQPVSDGASGDPRSVEAFADDARRHAQDQGLGVSADILDDDEIEVTVLNRGENAIPNATVRIWLPPLYESVALDESLLDRKRPALHAVGRGGAVDLHFGEIAPGERRNCTLERARTRR